MDGIKRLAEVYRENDTKALENRKHTETQVAAIQMQETIVKSFESLVRYLDNRVSKTTVVNQLKEIGTPDALKVAEAVDSLHETLKTHKNTDLTEVTKVLSELLSEAKKIPKELPEQKEQKFVDYTKQFTSLQSAIQSLEKVVKAQELIAEAPIVNVPETNVNVEAPDLQPLQESIKDVVGAVKKIIIPEYKTDNKEVEKLIKASNKLLKQLLDKPVSSGGGGGSSWIATDSSGIPIPIQLESDGSVPVTVVSGGSGGGLTDAELRATPVPVSGTVTANTGLSQPLTDTQLRATAVPVSISDNGPNDTLTGSASVTSATNLFSLDLLGYNTITVQVTSAGTTCTITYEASDDNSTWVAVPMDTLSATTTAPATTSTTVGLRGRSTTSRYFRARVSTYGSGTVTAYYTATAETYMPTAISANLAGQTLPTVTTVGTVTNITNQGQIVDNAAFTDGTTRLNMAGYIYDEVAGTALTENDGAAARINANRAVVNAIEDGSTRGRYATVTASNAVKVDGSAVTQPVSGTITANLAAGTNAIGKLSANSGVDIGDVDVTSAVSSSFDHGSNLDIDTTAEQITTTSFAAKFGVTIKADITNTGIVYIGNSDVTAGTTAATDGFPLSAGESLTLEVSNSNIPYAIASANNQKVYWVAT